MQIRCANIKVGARFKGRKSFKRLRHRITSHNSDYFRFVCCCLLLANPCLVRDFLRHSSPPPTRKELEREIFPFNGFPPLDALFIILPHHPLLRTALLRRESPIFRHAVVCSTRCAGGVFFSSPFIVVAVYQTNKS